MYSHTVLRAFNWTQFETEQSINTFWWEWVEYLRNRATGWAKYLLAPWARPTINTFGQTTAQTIRTSRALGNNLREIDHFHFWTSGHPCS